MIKWLDDARVAEAAKILWGESDGRPEIREQFHVIIYRALFGLAWSVFEPFFPIGWSAPKFKKTAEALGDAAMFFKDAWSSETKESIEVSAAFFSDIMAKVASRTKAGDYGQRIFLVKTCEHFFRVFENRGSGRPRKGTISALYEAVGILMEVGFKGRWPGSRVKSRYSLWKTEFSSVPLSP